MKQMIVTVLGLMMICIGGCTTGLTPHQEINQALTKSLDATGFNFNSKSRVTDLSIPKQAANAEPAEKNLQYLGAGLDIVRGFSVNLDGAVDMKSRKSEALYDLHYSKDNVEISVKVPMLVDYNTQTLYIGTSFLNTVLDLISPQNPQTKGKLIRINFAELLKDSTAGKPELSELIGEDRFSTKNVDLFNSAFKAALLKSVAKLNDTCFSDQPLSEQDRKTGAVRRIQVNLGHSDSVTVILDIVDSLSQDLFQAGVISKSEYAALLTLTDRPTLDQYINKFTLTMTYDFGVAQSGFVGHLVSRLNVSDREEGSYRIGLENVSSFDSYNAPHFSMSADADQTIDFNQLLGAILAAKPTAQDPSEAAPEELDDFGMTEEPDLGGS